MPARRAGHLGNDILNVGDGADSLDAFDPQASGNESAGGDNYVGGPGVDTVSFALRGDPMTITFDGVANDGAPGEGDMYNDGVEIVVSGNGDDTLIGNDGSQELYGSFGDDTIQGAGGGDVVDGGEGADTVLGGAGNDRVEGDGGPDSLDGGPGADEIVGDDSGGDPGPDSVNSADGEADLVLCGGATDDATVDQLDNVERSTSFACENVTVQTVGGGAGGGGAADTAAPSLRSSFSRRLRLGTVFSRGLSFSVTLGEPARVQTTVTVDGRTARRYRLVTGRRARRVSSLTIGRTTRSLPAGRRGVRVKVARKHARKLRRARSLTLKVTVTATDAAGNKRTTRKTLRLKR